MESPGHWKGKDFLYLFSVLGTGLLLYTVDEKIQNWSCENSTDKSRDFFRIATYMGDGAFISALLVSLYASGELFQQDSLRYTALLGLESFVISGVLVSALKFFIGRARPYTGEDSTSFRPFSFTSSNYSFPSGHSASAWALASVIASQSKSFLLDLFSYSMAALVSVSRVRLEKHWASDVLIGSALGYFIGKKIVDLNRNRDRNNLKVGIRFSRGIQVISLTFSF